MAHKEKVSMPIAQAKEEIKVWLRRLNNTERRIESATDDIEKLAELMSEGRFIIHDDNTSEYRLLFPVMRKDKEGNESVHISSLNFKARMSMNDVKPYLQGIKQNDTLGMSFAYACALTKTPTSIMDKLELKDSLTAMIVTGFFL